MNFKKYSFVSVLLIIVIAGGLFIFFKKTKSDPNQKSPPRVETPPQAESINSLPLSSRPYVGLYRNTNPNRCNGVDMKIEYLKNDEKKVEYELEYTTDKLIQAVFGTREFNDQDTDFKPLEFGTCSHGKCKCDKGVNGGSLKLSFYGNKDYVLKNDFVLKKMKTDDYLVTSKDVRLNIDFANSLKVGSEVIVMSTFGLPKTLDHKVDYGPYGIFIENNQKLDAPVKAYFQDKSGAGKKVFYWNGDSWEELESVFADGKVSFDLPNLGVVVLTE